MSHHPPGFRFYPTEEELLGFFLPNKLNNMREDMERVIPVVDVYSFDPWQLPPIACVGDSEQWFFFCPRQAREAHGGRPGRTTPAGYWKATGSPSLVYSSDKRVLGRKKTMVFYRGRAPVGTKTKWKMNEYRALAEDATNTPGATPELRNEFSLCRVYVNTGSMRSFDRRPVGAASDNLRALDPASTSTANQSMAERASSQDSSASGDDDSQPSAAGGGGDDWMMMQDIDWESLDRL